MTTVEEAIALTGSVWIKDEDFYDKVDLRASNLLHYQGFSTISHLGDMESNVASNILRLKHENHDFSQVSIDIIDAYIDEFEATENEGRQLHYHQRDAVKMVVNNPISILTGGPGTGKTTVLSAIAFTLRKLDPEIRISYTAPTGKAANRIKESTGEDATTTHKKLGLGRGNEPEPFFEDVLFVDESSMMDLFLANALFKSIPLGKRIVIVGDVNQLPSVGCGAILRDMISSKSIEYTMLTKTFRQDNSSTLFQNIENIKNGIEELVEGNDFHSFKIDEDQSLNDIAKLLKQTYIDCVAKYGIDNVCLLLPYRKNNGKTINSDIMSPFIQSGVNKETSGFAHKKDGVLRIFKKGDLVMQLENRKECANGDIGKVISVSTSGIMVEYAALGSEKNNIVSYSKDSLNEIALAYSMTIHKSQGSEYKAVIMCILDSHKAMLNRNLLYTGITRAKKECYLFYQPDALSTSIRTKADEERFSFLAQKMRQLDIQYNIEKYY